MSFWDGVAPVEETDRADEAINRELRWREIARHLDGVVDVLDVGAGTGAFSVPLAEQGFVVTHFDISAEMIARARERSKVRMDFVQGSATDLGGLTADLVLVLDGAISFAGADAGKVIAEACAATRKTLIVTVSNKATMVATWLKDSLKATGRILPAVHEMIATGAWNKDRFPENALLFPETIWFPTFKAFTAVELRATLEACNMHVETVRAIGSLTHLMLPHGVEVPKDAVDLCEQYDIDVAPDGPGSFRRAGLMAVAHPR